MGSLTRPILVWLAVIVAALVAVAYWQAPVPRGLLVDALAVAALAGAATGLGKRRGGPWPRRVIWMACGALALAVIASMAWMPPWIFVVALGLAAGVVGRRASTRWALPRALGLMGLGFVLNVYLLGALTARTPLSADPAEYRALDLRAHSFLDDVPLHDVWVIDLPGGGEGRGIRDLLTLPAGTPDRLSVLVPGALIWIRIGVGRVLGWETERAADPATSYARRLTPADRARCPGQCESDPSGPFGIRVLYTFDREMIQEVQNRTVHAFLAWAVTPTPDGSRLFVGIYVKRTSWFTPVYMATVDPFRRLVVYPGLRTLQRRWQARWGG